MEIYLIYGISDCPACLKTQAALMDRDIEYVFINADFSETYRDVIREEFEQKSFPIIIKVSAEDEELVGGYDDLCYALEKEQRNPPPTVH